MKIACFTVRWSQAPQRWVSHISSLYEDLSARDFGPEPLDLAFSAELGPNIVELDVHGTNGMEDGNGCGRTTACRKVESGITTWRTAICSETGMEDNDMGDNGVEDNDTDDTTMSDYLGEDASLRAPYDRHFESSGMAGGRTEPKKRATDRTTGT